MNLNVNELIKRHFRQVFQNSSFNLYLQIWLKQTIIFERKKFHIKKEQSLSLSLKNKFFKKNKILRFYAKIYLNVRKRRKCNISRKISKTINLQQQQQKKVMTKVCLQWINDKIIHLSFYQFNVN